LDYIIFSLLGIHRCLISYPASTTYSEDEAVETLILIDFDLGSYATKYTNDINAKCISINFIKTTKKMIQRKISNHVNSIANEISLCRLHKLRVFNSQSIIDIITLFFLILLCKKIPLAYKKTFVGCVMYRCNKLLNWLFKNLSVTSVSDIDAAA